MAFRRFASFDKLPKETAVKNLLYGVLIQEQPNVYVKNDCEDDIGSAAISTLKDLVRKYGTDAKCMTFIINFTSKTTFNIEFFIECVNCGKSLYEYIDADSFKRDGNIIKQFLWNGMLFSVSSDKPNITNSKCIKYTYNPQNFECIKLT